MEPLVLQDRKAKDSFLRMVESTLGFVGLSGEQEKVLQFSLKIPEFYRNTPISWATIEQTAALVFSVPTPGEVTEEVRHISEYETESRWVHRLNMTDRDDMQKLKAILHRAFELAARGEEEFVVIDRQGAASGLGMHNTSELEAKIYQFLNEHWPQQVSGKYQSQPDEDLADRFDYIREYIAEASSLNWKMTDVKKVIGMMNSYAPPPIAQAFEQMVLREFVALGGALNEKENYLCVQTPDLKVPFYCQKPRGEATGFLVQPAAANKEHTARVDVLSAAHTVA